MLGDFNDNTTGAIKMKGDFNGIKLCLGGPPDPGYNGSLHSTDEAWRLMLRELTSVFKAQPRPRIFLQLFTRKIITPALFLLTLTRPQTHESICQENPPRKLFENAIWNSKENLTATKKRGVITDIKSMG